MNFLVSTKRIQVVRPTEGAFAVFKSFLCLFLAIAVILGIQKIQQDRLDLEGRLEISHKNAASEAAENKRMKAQMKEMRLEVAKAEYRYTMTLKKSVRVIEESKEKIRRLENAAEALMIEREILQRKLRGYQSQPQGYPDLTVS